MKEFVVEVCVDSVESAVAAWRGGAHRLELCGELVVGGITPSLPLFKQVKEAVEIPIRCMVRPRSGDFLYSADEFEQMQETVAKFGAEGAQGVVFGVLLPGGILDVKPMEKLIALAKKSSMDTALHRAFDMTKDPFATLEQAKSLRLTTVLTAGGRNSAWEGRGMLKQLVANAGEVEILAGAGVSAANVQQLWEYTGATSFHLSGKQAVDSGMQYRNPAVSMGLPGFSEYSRWVTAENKVQETVATLEGIKR